MGGHIKTSKVTFSTNVRACTSLSGCFPSLDLVPRILPLEAASLRCQLTVHDLMHPSCKLEKQVQGELSFAEHLSLLGIATWHHWPHDIRMHSFLRGLSLDVLAIFRDSYVQYWTCGSFWGLVPLCLPLPYMVVWKSCWAQQGIEGGTCLLMTMH